MKDRFWVFRIAVSMLCLLMIINGCNSKTAIEKMIDKGNAKFENADFADAAKTFSEVIKNDPDNLKAYFRFASANLCLESNIDKFWKTIYRITVVDPSLNDLLRDPTYSQSGYSTDKLQKNYMIRKEKLLKISDEISAFTNAISKNPDNPKLYFGRGYWHFMLDDIREAAKDFSSAIKLDNTFEKAFIWRGNCYRSGYRDYTGFSYTDYYENQFRTEYNYRRAIQINPKNLQTLWSLWSHNYSYADRPGSGVEILSSIIAVDSTDRYALLNRAQYRINLKDYKGAMHDYALLVKNFPENSDYWVGLGLQKINLGMKQEGMKDLRKALAICKDKYYMKVIQGMIDKNTSVK
ncbi:MAG: tetratricopeptide repeat protein [Melioribacteraceae bacterium]